ncbi:MAG: CotH kinase family protein [Bacteroidota bacterium]
MASVFPPVMVALWAMIVKQHRPLATSLGKTLLLILGLGGSILLLFQPWKQVVSPQAVLMETPAQLFCGAEQVVEELVPGDPIPKPLFVGRDSTRFGNGDTQSDAKARTGQYSCRLDSFHNYGMTYTFLDLKPLDRISASVWRYNVSGFRAFLVFHLTGNKEFYKRIEVPLEVKEDGWELLQETVAVPFDFEEGMMRVYVYGYGPDEAYFDDFALSYERAQDSIATYRSLPELDLEIPKQSLAQLDRKRIQAIDQGLLIQGEDDWVKGRMHSLDSSYRIKLRLKGDLPDHFRTPKWSYRVRMKSGQAWNRLTTFSLHTPLARDYLSEWVYHEWLRREGVVSTRYDFLHLKVNGQTRGIYAYEEHFEKQLVEFQNRREGPIVKFDETEVWFLRKRAMDGMLNWGEMERQSESEASAPAQAFRENRLTQDSVLRQQLETAVSLLTQFQQRKAPASELFDLELMAKYCVITDLSRAYHGLIWHNLRFYFNPVTTRLEPIGFDGFTESGAFEWLDRPFLGAKVDEALSGPLAEQQFKQLFLDPAFLAQYYAYLDSFTQDDYLTEFQLSLEPELQWREQLLQEEFPEYGFGYNAISNRAHQVRKLLFAETGYPLQVYQRRVEGDSLLLGAFNRNLTALQLLIGPDKTPGPIIYPSGKSAAQEIPFKVPLGTEEIAYQIPGVPQGFTTQLIPYAPPGPGTPIQGLFSQAKLDHEGLYEVAGKQIVFYPGQHQLARDVIIPAGYIVEIPAGTELDLIQGSKFVSRSPVHMQGREDQLIRWYTSDGKGQGIVLLQTDAPSQWRYVMVDGLNTVSVPGWQLTGSVTAYEADVRLEHCSFVNAPCEDGLNLIRSHFRLSNCTIAHTFSDGFDADFCQGEVRNCFFVQTGNDGMDFSGSEVAVHGARVEGSGDKGISVGEESSVEMWDFEVENAVSGAVAKDLSNLLIHNIRLFNCQTGFAAYQKKPEFGPATVEVKSYQAKGIRHLHLVEKGSTVLLQGKQVEGI